MSGKQQKRKPFNFVLSPDEYDMLQALTKQSGQSSATVLREALRNTYAFVIQRIPLCATGQPCFVPQMHIAPMPARPPMPASLEQSLPGIEGR